MSEFGDFHDGLHRAVRAVEEVLDARDRTPALYDAAADAIERARRVRQPASGAKFEIFLGSAYADVLKAKPLQEDQAIRTLVGEARAKLKTVVGDLHRLEPHEAEPEQ